MVRERALRQAVSLPAGPAICKLALFAIVLMEFNFGLIRV